MASPPQRRRAARHHTPADDPEPGRRGRSGGRRTPITVDVVVGTALGIVEREGYAALTMRRVAAVLGTGPASLYAHVVNKEDLDDLLIGRICADVELPAPDPHAWREQVVDVCHQLHDRYARYPGVSLAALATVPTDRDTLRVSEGLLGIVLAGGVDPQTAAWAVDALLLYVNAFCLEAALADRRADRDGTALDRDGLLRRLALLPDTFPHTRRHAAEVTSGTGLERFRFTLDLITNGLRDRPGDGPRANRT